MIKYLGRTLGLTYIFDLIRIIGDAKIVLQITNKPADKIHIQPLFIKQRFSHNIPFRLLHLFASEYKDKFFKRCMMVCYSYKKVMVI